jgi:hypothetical protein
VLVGGAILGLALVLLLAPDARVLKAVATALCSLLVGYGVYLELASTSTSLLAGGAVVLGAVLLRSINETAHLIAVAHREPRRAKRRRRHERVAMRVAELELDADVAAAEQRRAA